MEKVKCENCGKEVNKEDASHYCWWGRAFFWYCSPQCKITHKKAFLKSLKPRTDKA
jgi:endogenous inhibitor of DNA gyrase (YacG/DUF329 family)